MFQFYHLGDSGAPYSGYGCYHRSIVRWFPDRTELFQWKVLSLNLARLTASAVGGLGLINILEVRGGVENW